MEDELLLHVAAGTDPLTAFTALPRESDSKDEPQPSTPIISASRFVWAVLVFFAMIGLWYLMG